MPSLKKNVLYQSVYQILVLLAPLVTAPYVSRVLGPEGVGLNSWTFSVAEYFVLVAMLGIANHGARTIARVRGDRERLNREFSDLLFVHVLVSALAVVAYLVFVLAFVEGNRTLFAIQGLWIVAAALDLNWFFSGIEQFGVIVARNTVIKLATIISIFVFVRGPGDLWVYVAILALGALLGQASVWPFVTAHITYRRPVWASAITHIRPLLVLFAPVVAVSFYRITSRVMLGAMTSEAQVGFYANAEKIIGIPLGLIGAFAAVMLPRMSNLVASGNEGDVKRLMSTSFRYVWLVGTALTFGLAGIGLELAPLFFGEDFAATGPLIVGMAVTIPFMAFSSVIRAQCLIPRSLDKKFTASLFCGAIVSVIANLVLIPRLEAVGAVIAIVLAEITVCVVQMISVRDLLPIGQYVRLGAFFLVAGIAMFLSVRGIAAIMESGVAMIVVQIVVGAAVYSTASAVYLWRVKDGVFLEALKRLDRFRGSRTAA
ncbi:polysaccharide biosynthesis protein [Xylanimonas cellulosilytica DSM 15894]|uniref:Polysaccharide biosynthesis protein n=1 Tax=Xylanimonas cellulosilytica (strain DSM 15894 / JCM 12276 / CECT 5975 / KCTC 9989 / LMG 20990 / NBRC 107835 / XIL07) TaxID=446471 RepID=D1BZ21_XYLCX|nr:flippase [Xylanimonas cellulosilytica]ACZ31918.1 polysaccharide biosynthesis protein [Xylanimonas cellulosilytica DSM 15894]